MKQNPVFKSPPSTNILKRLEKRVSLYGRLSPELFVMKFPFFLMLSLLLCGCAIQRAEDATTARKILRGMDKESVFACMGIPDKKASEGAVEIWSYKSGNNYRETDSSRVKTTMKKSVSDLDFVDTFYNSYGVGNSISESRYCKIQILFREGKVSVVHYSGPTGGFMTDDEQCAFAVKNCLPKEKVNPN